MAMAENHSVRAYRHIRRMLLDGDVAPGARLCYGSIGREIGISATPVRAAVGQLASEGLVELVPQLGAVVRRLTRQEAIERETGMLEMSLPHEFSIDDR